MNLCKNCEQFIKYECRASFFRQSGRHYGWWVSRQGSKMNYWGGAAVNSSKCACGMADTCVGGGKCNCNANKYKWREDCGYLTDKNTLPVTELRFGDQVKKVREDTIHWENSDVGVRMKETTFKYNAQPDHYYIITALVRVDNQKNMKHKSRTS